MPDVLMAVNPLLLVTRLIGLGPFSIDKKKKLFKVHVPGLFYSGLMLLVFVSNAAYLTYNKTAYKEKRRGSYIGWASDVILLTCGIVVTICSILLTIVQRNKYVRVVRDFYDVDFEMIKLNEQVPYKTVHKYACRHLVLLFVLLTLLFIHTAFYMRYLNTALYLSYLYAWFVPKIYNFLMEYQFVSGVLLLRMHFDLLNKSLGDFDEFPGDKNDINKIPRYTVNTNAWAEDSEPRLNTRLMAQTLTIWEGKLNRLKSRKIWSTDFSMAENSENLKKIKIIRKNHSILCGIREYLNSSFSLQLLTSVAQAFVFITANLYTIFTTLSSSNFYSVLALSYPIIWSAVHTAELVVIVLACTNTSKAGNYTAVLVHKLLTRDCKPELKNQLKLFSIQLLHRKITFTASGFFNLDMTLLQAIIGAATTYLVILIQFHNAYDNTK